MKEVTIGFGTISFILMIFLLVASTPAHWHGMLACGKNGVVTFSVETDEYINEPTRHFQMYSWGSNVYNPASGEMCRVQNDKVPNNEPKQTPQ